MASTNKTTHYNLSQYVGSDKPTYLADYNTDMSNIDTGIYNAKSEADTNATNIGTLSSLTTTAKSSLVSAINEVDAEADSNTSKIGTLSSLTTTAKTNLVSAINEVDAEADSNTSKIGTLSSLTTTAKTNLVSAINEVDAEADSNTSKIGNLTNLDTTEKSNLVGALNEISDITKAIINNLNLSSITVYQASQMTSDNGTFTGSITIATNADKSLCKIYGSLNVNPAVTGDVNITIAGTSLRPESEFFISNAGLIGFNVSTPNQVILPMGITLKTNGDVVLNIYCGNSTPNQGVHYLPMLFFVKDFGDSN